MAPPSPARASAAPTRAQRSLAPRPTRRRSSSAAIAASRARAVERGRLGPRVQRSHGRPPPRAEGARMAVPPRPPRQHAAVPLPKPRQVRLRQHSPWLNEHARDVTLRTRTLKQLARRPLRPPYIEAGPPSARRFFPEASGMFRKNPPQPSARPRARACAVGGPAPPPGARGTRAENERKTLLHSQVLCTCAVRNARLARCLPGPRAASRGARTGRPAHAPEAAT